MVWTAPIQRCHSVHPLGLWCDSIYPRKVAILPWGPQCASSLPGSVLVACLPPLLEPPQTHVDTIP